MRMTRACIAELIKLLSQPGAQGAALLAVLGTVGVAVFDAYQLRIALETGDPAGRIDMSTTEAGLPMMFEGALGVSILGIVAMTNEYTRNLQKAGGGRQIASTLVAIPGRGTVFVAKSFAVAVVASTLAFITVPLALFSSQLMLGPAGELHLSVLSSMGWRYAGAVGYWTLIALFTLGIGAVTREGTVPIVVLVVGASAVSAGAVASNLSGELWFTPDVAGLLMFLGDSVLSDYTVSRGDRVLAVGAMLLWASVSLLPGYFVFSRRALPHD